MKSFLIEVNEHWVYYENIKDYLLNIKSNVIDKDLVILTNKIYEFSILNDISTNISSSSLSSIQSYIPMDTNTINRIEKFMVDKNNSLSISYINKQTVGNYEYMLDQDTIDSEEWLSYSEYQKCFNEKYYWQITYYPDTPIGSYVKYGSDINTLLTWLENI